MKTTDFDYLLAGLSVEESRRLHLDRAPLRREEIRHLGFTLGTRTRSRTEILPD